MSQIFVSTLKRVLKRAFTSQNDFKESECDYSKSQSVSCHKSEYELSKSECDFFVHVKTGF
jgi:hypothetical protein